MTRAEIADDELVARHRGGDRAAFGVLVARHRRTVYLVARRLLGNHEDADEAAQVAFVRAWRSLDGFRGDAAVRTWLIKIVLNVAKSMREKRPTEGLDDCDQIEDRATAADEKVERERAYARVRAAIATLPPRQKEVVILKVFSELSYAEVAGAMELTEGAVKAHLHQAVANLRRRLRTAQERRPA